MDNSYEWTDEFRQEVTSIYSKVPQVEPPVDREDAIGWARYYKYMWHQTSLKCLELQWRLNQKEVKNEEQKS